ncbi:MAG TPA: hypothetical protein DDX51_05745 [Clostridiales bacterium]|nr:hypothetical protein [Clostridiales bacterium]
MFAGVCLDGYENICPAVTGLIPVMRYRYVYRLFCNFLQMFRFASPAGFPTGFFLFDFAGTYLVQRTILK